MLQEVVRSESLNPQRRRAQTKHNRSSCTCSRLTCGHSSAHVNSVINTHLFDLQRCAVEARDSIARFKQLLLHMASVLPPAVDEPVALKRVASNFSPTSSLSARHIGFQVDDDPLLHEYAEEFQEAAVCTENLERHLNSLIEVTEGLSELHAKRQQTMANESMNTWTAIQTVCFPVTIMTGLWGMNFTNMPELKDDNSYFWAVGALALYVIVALSWWYLRSRTFNAGTR